MGSDWGWVNLFVWCLIVIDFKILFWFYFCLYGFGIKIMFSVSLLGFGVDCGGNGGWG